VQDVGVIKPDCGFIGGCTINNVANLGFDFVCKDVAVNDQEAIMYHYT
jgi:hypothetical protein